MREEYFISELYSRKQTDLVLLFVPTKFSAHPPPTWVIGTI